MHGWRIGTIAGISIEINFTWLIVFGLIIYTFSTGQLPVLLPHATAAQLWITGLITALLFFASLLLHELAHSLMAQHLGAKVARITLFIFGGVSQMTHEPKDPGSEFKISVVGPLTSIVLGLGFLALYRGLKLMDMPRLWSAPCLLVGEINLLLAAFNMLPAFPLDGGRVLRSILWHTWGSLERATRAASTAGRWFGYLMIGFGIMQLMAGQFTGGLWMLALGWLLSSMAAASYQRVQFDQALGGVHVHDLMSSPVATIPADTSLEDAVHNYFLVARFTAFGVEEQGQITGLVRMDQIRAVDRSQWPVTTVGQIMQPLDDKATVRADEDAVEALMKMAENETGRLLVTDWSGKVIGIISQSDIIRLVRLRGGLGV